MWWSDEKRIMWGIIKKKNNLLNMVDSCMIILICNRFKNLFLKTEELLTSDQFRFREKEISVLS